MKNLYFVIKRPNNLEIRLSSLRIPALQEECNQLFGCFLFVGFFITILCKNCGCESGMVLLAPKIAIL